MTTRNRKLHVGLFRSAPEHILRNSTAATADGIRFQGTDFAAQLAQMRQVDDLWQHCLTELAKTVVCEDIEDDLQEEGIDERQDMR